MGLIIGLIKRLIKLTIYFLIFASVVVLIPNLPPYTSFSSIPIEPTLERVGPLAPNGELNNAERLYKGKLLGPEAFQTLNGELYTGLATGEIVKVTPGGHVTFVTKLGQPCTGLVQEHICGRPLGFEIDEKNLYVADAYHGIWKVDLKTDKKQLLVSPRVDIDRKRPMIFNSVVKDKNGNLYWTDSSSDFNLKDGAITLLADPSGRLFQYNAAKNESKVLVDNMWFANGLVISPDNQFLVVVETSRYRLLKYYINGPNKGKTEVFVAGLPGAGDNIRALPDGSGVLVALYTVFDDEHPLITKSLAATPVIRKFAARLQRLIEIPFEYLNNFYPHVVFEDIIYFVGNFKSVSSLTPGMAGLVQIDWNGNIVASYYNTDGSLDHISDAILYNDRLYTGGPIQDFIGSVPVPSLLKKAFTPKKSETVTSKAKSEQVKQDSKPAQPPKVEIKKEAPKITKPVVQEIPKQKPTENDKPTTQKPIEKKAETVQKTTTKPQQQPTQAKSEPTATKTTAKPETKTTQKPEIKTTVKPETITTQKPETKTTQKPETKTTPPPKTTDTKPKVTVKSDDKKATTAKPIVKSTPMPKSADKKTESPRTTTAKPDKSKDSQPKQQKPPKESKSAQDKTTLPEQIPIKEEIPSDTRKPDKETLKVIKKGGPAEIPNFN